MTRKPASFGRELLEKRIAMGISLRKFAKLASVSPTYVSQVEQRNVDSPTAERVTWMAELLEENADEWIALAGRVPEDLPESSQISLFNAGLEMPGSIIAKLFQFLRHNT
jgi:transcriptional regulator with XRE-family HTH domain